MDVLCAQPKNTTKQGTAECFDQLVSNYQLQHCEDSRVWDKLLF